MADKIQQTSASSLSAKPAVSASSRVVPLSKPVAANAAEPAVKKPAAKKKAAVKKSPARKTAAKKKTTVRAVKAKVTATRKASPRKTVKATKTASAKPAASASIFSTDTSKIFESLLKPSENFFNFKPNNQTVEKLMTQNKNQMEKIAQDAATFSRDGIEACIKSGNLWMRGVEDIMRTAMSLAQSSAEKQGKLVKEAMASKTLNEWAEAQNKIVQSNFDDFMAGATKLSELSVKVLSECTEPVNAQASKAVKKVTETMAA